MNRYILGFSKLGYTKYTSHLDLLRLFKRGFKRTGILLEHSHGFNPHPKMGFAQPLSLGYTSTCEIIEFETVENFEPEEILKRMKSILPDGIEASCCRRFDENIKSLAAIVTAAEYKVTFPLKSDYCDFKTLVKDYLDQDEITAMKKKKKTKKMVEVNIKDKIRKIDVLPEEMFTLRLYVDCGSISNLSPELVISSFLEFTDLPVKRYDIDVERTSMEFGKNFHI